MAELTDREALEQLLARFGLEPYAGGNTFIDPADDEIVLVAKEGGVEGYSNFHARFRFDDDGKFETLGIWE